MQILRLTTPNLHPTNEDLFVGTPERLKRTFGAPFAQNDSVVWGSVRSSDRARSLPCYLLAMARVKRSGAIL
jgi:hypothetical protein